MQKSYWQSIIDNDFALPGDKTLRELTPELLVALGSTDPELRDSMAYPILANWIDNGHYSPDQLRQILAQMQKNLSSNLGETSSDSVFLRAFSSLVICEITSYDSQNRFLRNEELQALLEAAIVSLEGEKDLRGHIPTKGWAHAIAHLADLLGLLALHPEIQAADLERILMAIATKLCQPLQHTYIYLEDERLALATIFALRRNLLQTDFLNLWLEQLTSVGEPFENANAITFVSPAEVSAYHNVQTYLRSLYFQLAFNKEPIVLNTEMLIALETALKVLDHGFYIPEEQPEEAEEVVETEEEYDAVHSTN